MYLFIFLVRPVAVDGDGDEQQHGYDDRGDDYSQRDVVLPGIVDRTHYPLTVTELHLRKRHRPSCIFRLKAVDMRTLRPLGLYSKTNEVANTSENM